ncbi:uncharacterized protein LOC131659130 [Vicia villosa]|uniref:uncharacterized protein LOC131659130 n=1 Tax=Vicia villosa TaxID=3911 RepID=UPI00273A8BAC|nr:uncharacterized protein LOC131659130 [Vicia villosa]
MDDRLEDMMRDIGQDSFKRAHVYDSLYNDKDTPLYPGCTNFTRLSAVLKLFYLKAINGGTDKSFTELLELLTKMLPEGNVFPSRYYEVKKIFCPMGLEYEKIHACPNGCILYRKENVNYNHCPKCKASRYKKIHGESSDDEEVKKGPPVKVHAKERKCDGQIRHVADSLQWKKIDSLFPNFGKESRNLRLGLSTDGMNLFGLVGGRVDVFDAQSSEQFNMHAMLFCTINDFPAYGNLFGYKVKGHKACPICEKDTCFHQQENGNKIFYLGHRKFLNRYHPYRRLQKAFNREQEHDVASKTLIGEEVYQRQQDITAIFGKYQKRPIVKNIWKKRSVFFDLPYWSSLEVTRRICLLPATLCLKKEKTSFCECLESIIVPHGHSSNVKRLVSAIDLKLVGLKSHDCHVLMQKLLQVAICGILPNNVRKTITRLCLFFNAICCKAIDPLELDDLENEAAVILCQLEIFFPPSFFDIMIHLIVHLVRDISYMVQFFYGGCIK